MARRVRAVCESENQKYAGFDGHKRYVNNEEFDWKRPGRLPLVKRDADGNIVAGWVEMVSGDPMEGVAEYEAARAKVEKKKPDPSRKGLTPAMVPVNANMSAVDQARVTEGGSGGKGKGRVADRGSDRVVG